MPVDRGPAVGGYKRRTWLMGSFDVPLSDERTQLEAFVDRSTAVPSRARSMASPTSKPAAGSCRQRRVKAGETTSHADLMSASGVGSLIQATVGSFGGVGPAVAEPGGVGGVGGVEGDGPLGADLAGGAVVDRRRGVQPDAGVAVHMVVVIEERRRRTPGRRRWSRSGRGTPGST